MNNNSIRAARDQRPNTQQTHIQPLEPNSVVDPSPSIVPEDFSEQGQQRLTLIAVLFKLLPLGISTLILLYLLYLGSQISSLRHNSQQVFVQTANGRSLVAEPVDNYVRTPATVEATVKLWSDLNFNYVQRLPNGEKDPGRKIGKKVFPTRLINASTLLSPEMQQVWYEVYQKRDDWLPHNFVGSDSTRIFYPQLQTAPKQPIDPNTGKPAKGRYEVELYGNWLDYSSETPEGKLVDRLALRLHLRSVVKTVPPLSEDATPLQRVVYDLRTSGLEIYDIQRISYAR